MNANEIFLALEEINHYDDYGQFGRVLEDFVKFQQDEINALREQVQYLQTQVYGGTTK